MAEQSHQLPARTGTAELHHEPDAFGITAPGFVAISMFVVLAIILLMRVPGMISKMLDARIAGIRSQLDEAAKLRAEAEAQLEQAKARNAASANDAAAIIRNAEEEAVALRARAEAEAAELIVRRGRLAEDKIAAAERAAIQAVRAKAADVATQAAAAIISERHGAEADKPLVDRTIAGLGSLN